MSASVVCLLGLIGWSILLTFLVVMVRVKPILGGTFVFEQDGSDLPGFAQRVTRAHGNSLENLAIPAALILYGVATAQSAVTDGLAMIVLGAQVASTWDARFLLLIYQWLRLARLHPDPNTLAGHPCQPFL